MVYTIDIVSVPARHLAVEKFTVSRTAEIGPRMGPAFGAVMRYAGEHGIPVEGPAVGHYTKTGDGFDVAAGFVVREPFVGDGTVVGMELPAADVVTTTHIGSYEGLTRAYEALVDWADHEGRSLDERVAWEEYWSGPEVPESEHRTVVCWPLQRVSAGSADR
jgi:effector-binding domain-containing protein